MIIKSQWPLMLIIFISHLDLTVIIIIYALLFLFKDTFASISHHYLSYKSQLKSTQIRKLSSLYKACMVISQHDSNCDLQAVGQSKFPLLQYFFQSNFLFNYYWKGLINKIIKIQGFSYFISVVRYFIHIIIYQFLFKTDMGRQLKKDQLSKLYREFSRQRYTKYKHQFPRMRESELVSKIIKEWEALNAQDKAKLYKHFEEHQGLPDDKSDSSNQRPEGKTTDAGSKKTPISKLREKSRTPVKKQSGVKVYRGDRSEQKPRSESSDFARQEGQVQLSQSDSKGQIGVSKIKKIKKGSKQPKGHQTQYLKFFNFYYEKLHSEHPKWKSNQISTIIKLLWRKKLVSSKSKRSDLKSPRDHKPCSGRLAFRRVYGYGGVLGLQRWLQLTKESRKYWNARGRGKKSGERRIVATTLRLRNSLKRKDSEQVSGRPIVSNYINKPISALNE